MKRLLLGCVRSFPGPFRRQFGADMLEQIDRDYDRARRLGRRRAGLFWLLTAFDLLRCGVAEHRHPAWGRPRLPEFPGERTGSTMNGWIKDLRFAARTLRRSPGFALVTIGTLSLAIGVTSGIFSIVDTVLLNPLPFPEADRLVTIRASAPGSDFPPEFGVSAEFYLQYRDESEQLESIATMNSFTATLRADDRVERIRMSAPTSSLFTTLGVTPLLGRLPVPEDEDGVAIISHALWTSWFGADPSVIGRTYDMAGSSRTVVGVMGPEFWFPRDDVLLWITGEIREEGLVPGRFGVTLVGRLAPGATPDGLVNELTTLTARIPDRFGGSARYAELIGQLRPVVRVIDEQLLGPAANPLWVMLGSGGLVLLIACANVANLFMVRADRRHRDLAVRRALGAGRRRLIRSQMAEAIVVAAIAAGLAVAFAWATVPLFLRAAPDNVPRLGEAAITAGTLAFALGSALLAALTCGLFPAVRASAPDLLRLRDGGRGSTTGRHWMRDALVVAQTALALVLLIGSALLVRSFAELRRVDPGYDTEDIFTFQIAPEGEHLNDAATYARFHLDFMERLRALPGVESVGIVENVPLNEGVSSVAFRTESMGSDEDAGVRLSYTWAAGDYFEAMGIQRLAGRSLTDAEQLAATGQVVIGQAAAEALWPGEDPVGQRIRMPDVDGWLTVVGVVEDVLQYDFRDAREALVYLPMVGPGENPRMLSSPAYVIRSTRADEIAPEVLALVRQVAPEAPMYRAFTMEGLAADSMVGLSFTMLTLGVLSTLALVLGAVGLFGVLSSVVAQRTQEIGVRMALGAEARRVRRMVVAQGGRVVAVGIAIGLVVALGATRVLASLLFGVGAADVGTFAAMSIAMVLVGMLASYLPARRASSVDPIESLRGQ